ncbi:MAG: hypothetical protein NW226_13825 [Microscillaceae bacterium]|nr:hypothetical protein [Microscillaceae bacterium]
MTLLDLIRVLLSNMKLILIIPVVMAVAVHRLTKGMPDKYASETMIYTGVVSGFNLESTGMRTLDRTLVSSSFDNLMITIQAKATLKGVATRLLAQGLILPKPDSVHIGPRGFKYLREAVSEEVRKQVVVPNSFEGTLQKIEEAIEKEATHPLNRIIQGGGPYYSLKALSGAAPSRVLGSDMVKISYSSDDPGICVNTLQFLLEVFIKKYRYLKSSETDNVVGFFEKKLQDAQSKLTDSELRMKAFREDGKILNYYEQTKALANKKEDLSDEQSRATGELEASRAIIRELENKLGIDKNFLSKNEEILKRKQKLSEVNTSIALKEINSQANGQDLEQLKKESRKLKSSLEQDIVTHYNFTHSTEGLPIQQLLSEWLDNIILIETNKAKEKAITNRLGEIEDLYDQFAPLGSGLTRLEREIGVNEQEYIQMIHDLNLALLRQQNIEISSNISVVDAPNLQSLGNQRILLVIVSFMVGFITITGSVLAIELIDVTLKTPDRAVRFTKYALAGVFPLYNKKYRKINHYIRIPLLNLALSKIQVNEAHLENPARPIEIITFSVQEQEGKSLIGSKIAQGLHEADFKVLHLLPAGSESQFSNYQHFEVNQELLHVESIHNIIREEFDNTPYDYVVIELPALKKGLIPVKLFQNAHILLLTLRANRTWGNVDKYIMKNFIQEIGREPLLLLNGVKPIHLDSILGDVKGMKKSLLRRLFKKIVKMEFKSAHFKKAMYD